MGINEIIFIKISKKNFQMILLFIKCNINSEISIKNIIDLDDWDPVISK